MQRIISLYISHSTREEARTFCHTLLDKKLIACAHIFPIDSMYYWDAELQDSGEYISILKCGEGNIKERIAYMEALHPYDIPCILVRRIEANNSYAKWVQEQTAGEMPID